jgi:cobalamin biosynthesis Mg chelatase CobN
MREWAEARGEPWFILSAKHGLVHPDAAIADYDERGLTDEQATQIATMLVEEGVETAHLTAGTDYTNALVPELEARGIDTINHFAGKQIGERVSELGKQTRQMKNMSVGEYAHDA